MDQKSPPEGR